MFAWLVPSNGCKTLIGMHEMHGQMKWFATTLLVHGPPFIISLLYDHPHPSDSHMKTLIARQWPTAFIFLICRNYSTSYYIYLSAGAAPLVATDFFGRGDGPIAGNNVVCRGDENGIIDCMFDRNHNCGHENDVAVRCMTTDRG